jgi:predicted nucleic acid-binding protein
MAEFLDTNVLVYLFDRRDPRRSTIAAGLVAAAAEREAMISFQVVQETLNVLTRRLDPPLSAADARAALDDVLAPLWRIGPSRELYAAALDLRERYGFGFYDSLIVAAALAGGCSRLLSEDLQHGQQIDALRIENPFL